jgi:actin-related protein
MSEKILVIDNGSRFIKCGFAGEDKPISCFPAMIGSNISGTNEYIGSYAVDAVDALDAVDAVSDDQINVLNLRYPINHRIVRDWNDMEKLWHHTFDNELKVNPMDYPVLLTDAPLNPKANREKMVQIMFETFNVPTLYIANEAVLALYASERITGIVLHSADDVTHVVPIFEGYALQNAIIRLDYAENDLIDYLMKMLNESKCEVTSTTVADIITNSNLCYVAHDFEEELKSAESSIELVKPYELKNGEVIEINNERFRCCEALFQPKLIDKNESPGIHVAIYESIMKCDCDIRKELYGNIILSGSCTMFDGIVERLTREIKLLAPAAVTIKVVGKPERRDSVWIGGSILASTDTFQSVMITRADYDEWGPSIVHRKCF